MKRQFLLPLVVALLPLLSLAQGWPANYGGVMLQGFYWDSFQLDYASMLDAGWNSSDEYWEVPRTTWSVLNSGNVKGQITPYIDLIWLPQSGATTAPSQTTITGSGQRAEQMITDGNGKNKLQMWEFTNGEQFTINHADRMGFIPVWWFDHGKGKNYSWDDTQYTSTSAFGTEAELRALIRDYKNAGTFAIEDVVINHKGGPGMWNGSGKGRKLISENSSTGAPSTSNDVEWNYDTNVDIVDDDAHDYWNQYPYLENGNIKSESGFTGGTWGKDLRHDSENVQRNVIKYLDFLLNDLGYAGFRYDYVKGYDPKYLAMYNVATRPTFSVGEFFDGDQAYLESWIDKTYAEDTRQSAAFDFPLKFKMNEAFKNDEGNYAVLDNAGLIANYKMRRYAVTFVDNHDTFKNIPNDNTHRGFPNRMSKHVVEANMFILAMPGTPCLFYPHYMHPSWQPILQKCIKARRAAGVTNQAAISSVDKSGKHVQFNITGTKGKLKMQLGSTYSNAAVPEGYEVVHKEGDCRLLISTGLDWQNNVKETLIGGYATIDKMSGNYTSAFDVNIGASNNATQVVYTTNGTTPDAGSAKAPATLHITGSTTVKAGVVVNGVVDENSVVIRDYVMDHNDETGKIKVYISYSQYNSGYGYTEHPCIYAFKGDTKYTGDWPGWTELGDKENIAGVDWYVATIPASDIDIILHRGGSNSNLADVSKSATIKNVTHDIFLTYTDGVAHDVTAMYGSALHDPKLSIDVPSGSYNGSLNVKLNSTRDDPYVGQKKAQIVYVTWAAGETPKHCSPVVSENDGELWGSGTVTIHATSTEGSSHYLRAAIVKDGQIIHEQARSYFLTKTAGTANPVIDIYVKNMTTADVPQFYLWNGATKLNGERGNPTKTPTEVTAYGQKWQYLQVEASSASMILHLGDDKTQTADITGLTGSTNGSSKYFFYYYPGARVSTGHNGYIDVTNSSTKTTTTSNRAHTVYVSSSWEGNKLNVWYDSNAFDKTLSELPTTTISGTTYHYGTIFQNSDAVNVKIHNPNNNNEYAPKSSYMDSYKNRATSNLVYSYCFTFPNNNDWTDAAWNTSHASNAHNALNGQSPSTEVGHTPTIPGGEGFATYTGLSSSVTPIEDGREGFFFENDVDFGMPFAWVYEGTTAYSGNAWPGEQLIEVVGTAPNGNTIYRWTWSDGAGDEIPAAAKVIFSNNGDNTTQKPGQGQTGFDYVRNGYYTSTGNHGQVGMTAMTLSALIAKAKKEGSNFNTSTYYTITNDLEVAFVSADGYLYAKDKDGQALDMSVPTAGQVVHDVLSTKNYDQSNWIAIKVLSEEDARSTFGTNGQAKLLGGTINGKFSLENGNPVLTVDHLPNEFEPVYDTYDKPYEVRNHVNTYFPAHFGSHRDRYGKEFFFVTPKHQEYAKITDAVYNGGALWMPVRDASSSQNINQFNGGIDVVVDNNYKDANRWAALVDNNRYTVTGIIRGRSAQGNGAPRRVPSNPYLEGGSSSNYEIVLITTEADNTVVTGVENVDVERTVQSVSYVDLMGRMSTRPHNGVNVVVTTYTDGTKKTTKVVF